MNDLNFDNHIKFLYGTSHLETEVIILIFETESNSNKGRNILLIHIAQGNSKSHKVSFAQLGPKNHSLEKFSQ